jgi:terminase large subunit-like protein
VRKFLKELAPRGIPVLGSGLIFPVTDDQITCKPIDYIPQHWPQLGAMDFGWEHPFAAVQLAWDRDADVVYVTKAYRMSRGTPVTHSAALRGWGKELRWAWPRDGRRETLEGAGIALAEQYRDQGLNMLRDHAQFDDGGVSVESGLMAMLDRMQTGKLKVYAHLLDWFEERRMYHRKDGKVVKLGDDLMSATRYGIMMLRHAGCQKGYGFNRELAMPSLGLV